MTVVISRSGRDHAAVQSLVNSKAFAAAAGAVAVIAVVVAPASATATDQTLDGHYIETMTTTDGNSVSIDLFFTPCGDGCASVASTLGGQVWGHAKLVNGQWTMDGLTNLTCPDGTKIANGGSYHDMWDPNTLAGVDEITWIVTGCGNAVGTLGTNSLQLKQAP